MLKVNNIDSGTTTLTKVAMKGLGLGSKHLQRNIDLFPGIPADPDR